MSTRYTTEWNKNEAEVISMEEYLMKRKKIRENEKKQKENRAGRKRESLTPFEFYMVSSLAWS